VVRKDHSRGKVGLGALDRFTGLTFRFLRLFFFQIAGIFERCKYYAIWTLTEVRASAASIDDSH
jgi:hypothetical protein